MQDENFYSVVLVKFRLFSVYFRTCAILVKCIKVINQSMYGKSQGKKKKLFWGKKMAHTDF